MLIINILFLSLQYFLTFQVLLYRQCLICHLRNTWKNRLVCDVENLYRIQLKLSPGSPQELITGFVGSIPGSSNGFPMINDSQCDRMHFYLTADLCSVNLCEKETSGLEIILCEVLVKETLGKYGDKKK